VGGRVSGLRTGWQTLLADLSLVLFIITAAALGRNKHDHRALSAPAFPPPSGAVSPPSALAVYREGPDAPSLRTWLAQQVTDRRQQVTIVIGYAPGSDAGVPGKIGALLAAARDAGVRARIEIEPGSGGTSAGIGFDPPLESLARPLPDQASNQQDRTQR
jgi:hypothetical protein